ncbi:MAG: ABC transporter permease [Acidobacteriota bacterium]
MPISHSTLLRRGLAHYWRTHAAVVAGVVIAVAVLGGALLVGSSVRGSLRRIALQRLGNTGSVVVSATLFREQLAASIPGSVPLIALEGLVIHPSSRRRAGKVLVYGVDERFWRFHGVPAVALEGRDAWLSPALAAEMAAKKTDTLLLRLEKPGDIPAESIHGRKDDAAAAIRLRFEGALPAEDMGEFSLRPSQGAIRAIFVPLRRLQEDLGANGRVNTLLVSERVDAAAKVREQFTLADLGVRVKPVDGAAQLDTLSGVLSPQLTDIATHLARDGGISVTPVLTYLANSIRANGRETPYSLVAALPLNAVTPTGDAAPANSIVLNDWTARDLNAKAGDKVALDYYVWKDDGRLVTESSDFVVSAVVPVAGLAADRQLAPDYPGITDAESVSDWDPPFPMDLSRIRPRDEDYWDRYRTTAKAFVRIAEGQRLWSTRWGNVSALRLTGGSVSREEFAIRLRQSLDPAKFGLTVMPIRERTLDASRGSTDFGEYFLYFSFFLVVSALLLVGLFFRLGVEQRTRELGLLEAVGFTRRGAAWHFLGEGLVLAAIGSVLGLGAALGYASLIVYGLNTWWSGAVGTHDLRLAVEALPLLSALAFGIVMGVGVTALTLQRLLRETPRALLLGGWELQPGAAKSTRAGLYAICFAVLSLVLVAAGARGDIPGVAAFFGSGSCLLIAALTGLRKRLAAKSSSGLVGRSASLWPLAFRNLAIRPGRTLLVASLIASATFLVISVESFRREGSTAMGRDSGTGGYRLTAESVRPIYYNLNDTTGRETLNLTGLNDANFVSFRLKPGDDASCLNLYEPGNPRVLGAPQAFLNEGRFAWSSSLALTPEDKANPWLLLERQSIDASVIPAVADANSLEYVLHKKVGEIIEVPGSRGVPVRLQIVGALSDSLFQSELIISDSNFQKAFPDVQGFRVFLIDTPSARAGEVSAALEDAMSDAGFDAQDAGEKLAAFHRVENTYLATFQALGALGLLLGTLGLGTVLVRNVLERRREFALLAAVGFASSRLRSLVWRESLLMLAAGQLSGVASAAVAIAPIAAERGFTGSLVSMAAMMVAIFLTGVIACWLAAGYVARLPLVETLRAE